MNMAQNRMTAAEAWEGFVGSQTPAEFLSISADKGFRSIESAVAAYVKDAPDMFPGAEVPANLSDLLTTYITTAMEAAAHSLADALNAYDGEDHWNDVVFDSDWYDADATLAADPTNSSDSVILYGGAMVFFEHDMKTWGCRY